MEGQVDEIPSPEQFQERRVSIMDENGGGAGKSNTSFTKSPSKTVTPQNTEEVRKSINSQPVEEARKSVNTENIEEPRKSLDEQKVEDQRKSITSQKTEEQKKSITSQKSEEHKKSITSQNPEEQKKSVTSQKTEEQRKSITSQKTEEQRKSITSQKTEEQRKSITSQKTEEQRKSLIQSQKSDGSGKESQESDGARKSIGSRKSTGSKKSISSQGSKGSKKSITEQTGKVPSKEQEDTARQTLPVIEETSEQPADAESAETASSRHSIALDEASQRMSRTSQEEGPDSASPTETSSLTTVRTSSPGSPAAPGTPGSADGKSTVTSKALFLLDLTDEELVKAVEEMQTKAKHLELENMVFQHFLVKNDPNILEGFENFLENADQIQERVTMSRRATLSRMSRRESSMLTASINSSSSTLTTTQMLGLRGPRINLTQKMDLVAKEMEEIQENLETVTKHAHKTQFNLRSEIEEMTMRETEIRDSIQMFQQVFIQGEPVKNFTQANSTEKFVRYLNEWLKKARLSVDKIRLRTSSVKVQYQKLCGIIAQKSLLGENLQEVDFEQLQIENKHLAQKIDQRNLLLLELKRMNGHANLLLSQHKKQLLNKEADAALLREEIQGMEEKTLRLDEETGRVQRELDRTKAEYEKVKLRADTYKVPDIIDYVKKIAELGQLKKNLKVWSRRKQIQDMALNVCVRDMKNITGSTRIQAEWFKPPPDDAVNIYDREFHFQYEKKQKRWHLKKRSSGSIAKKYSISSSSKLSWQ